MNLRHQCNETNLNNCRLRRFKVSMQTTPLKYLMEYRLQKAAERLAITDEVIGTIAMNAAFMGDVF